MKYLFLLYGPDRPFPQPGTSEFREMLEAWNAATEAMAKAGVLIDCAPLQPAAARQPRSRSATARRCSPTGRPPRSRSSSAATPSSSARTWMRR